MTPARLVSLGVLLTTSLAAQQQPVFRANTRVVPIYATVAGADGRLLPGLTQDDFTVLDDGRPRPITVFSDQPAAITGLAMWDVSPAMKQNQARSRAAARALIEALWPDDRIRFGTFSGQEFAVSPLLTGDKTTLRRIVDEELWFSTTGIPLWNALKRSLVVLSRDAAGRRVLVVLSAGKSNLDPDSKKDTVGEMHRSDCMVYTIGLEGSSLSRDIRDVAEESGGGYVELSRSADLNIEFTAIVEELHHQYLIGFVSDAADGLRHTLTVRTRIAGAKVRARQAYVADKGGAGR